MLAGTGQIKQVARLMKGIAANFSQIFHNQCIWEAYIITIEWIQTMIHNAQMLAGAQQMKQVARLMKGIAANFSQMYGWVKPLVTSCDSQPLYLRGRYYNKGIQTALETVCTLWFSLLVRESRITSDSVSILPGKRKIIRWSFWRIRSIIWDWLGRCWKCCSWSRRCWCWRLCHYLRWFWMPWHGCLKLGRAFLGLWCRRRGFWGVWSGRRWVGWGDEVDNSKNEN